MKVRYGQIVVFMIMINLTAMVVAWLPGDDVYPLLEAKFGWDTDD